MHDKSDPRSALTAPAKSDTSDAPLGVSTQPTRYGLHEEEIV
jgi:hypothetical protein